MKFSDLVRSLDYLAPDVTLNVNGKSSVKTYLGSVLWLLSTGCFIASMVFSAAEFLDTTNPRVSIQNGHSQIYPVINLRKNHMVPIIIAYLDEVTAIPAEEVSAYFTFVLEHRTTKRTAVGLSPTKLSRVSLATPCSGVQPRLAVELGELADLVSRFGLCFDVSDEDFAVFGKNLDAESAGVYFGAYPCTLDDASLCKPVDQIQRLGFQYLVGEASMDLNDLTKPVQFEFTGDEFFRVDPGLSSWYTEKLMFAQVSDSRFPFEPEQIRASFAKVDKIHTDSKRRLSSQITCTQAQVSSENRCKPYVSKWITSGGSSISYKRTYKGVLELITNIGGARKFIYSLALVFYIWYHKRQVNQVLLESVLGIDCKQLKLARSQLKPGQKHKLDQAVEQATSLIERCLDVVTICRNQNKGLILSDFFLKNIPESHIRSCSLKRASDQKSVTTEFRKENTPQVSPLKPKSLLSLVSKKSPEWSAKPFSRTKMNDLAGVTASTSVRAMPSTQESRFSPTAQLSKGATVALVDDAATQLNRQFAISLQKVHDQYRFEMKDNHLPLREQDSPPAVVIVSNRVGGPVVFGTPNDPDTSALRGSFVVKSGVSSIRQISPQRQTLVLEPPSL